MTAILVAIARLVLQDFPNSGDEYVYLYQAATLAEGRLSNPLPVAPEFFQSFYVAHENGRAFGTFPIGWPLVLAAAMRLQVPPVVVNPLFGVATLVAMYLLGRELYGPTVAVLAVAGTAISPFFLLNSASYFSHTFCGFLLLMAAYAGTLAARRHSVYAVVVGFLIGWAVMTRYFTGAVAGLAIVIWAFRNGCVRAPRLLGLALLGGLPWAIVLAAYNAALSGSQWSLTTTPETFSNWFASGFLLRGPDITATHIVRLVLWTPPLVIAAYVYYLRRAPSRLRHGPLEWMLVVMAGALFFYVNRGGNEYGPRFYYEAALFAVPFTVANLFAERSFASKDAGDARVFALVAASAACVPLLLPYHLYDAHQTIRERRDPFVVAARARLIDSVVIMAGRVGTRRSMDPRDLTRNDFAFSKPVLFAISQDFLNCQLRTAFPERELFIYEWDADKRTGQLAALRC